MNAERLLRVDSCVRLLTIDMRSLECMPGESQGVCVVSNSDGIQRLEFNRRGAQLTWT